MKMDYENKAILNSVIESLICWSCAYQSHSPASKLYQSWLVDEVNIFYAL